VLVGRLPPARQRAARTGGLILAMATRLALLYSVVWLTHLRQPWVRLGALALTGRDLVLLVGGLFLLGSSVLEIRQARPGAGAPRTPQPRAGVLGAIVQIGLMDIVFSLDSVFTAVGLARAPAVMGAAIVVGVAAMLWLAGRIGALIERHPTIRMLALGFLVLIGAALAAEGMHREIPKGYLYLAMALAVAVELTRRRLRRR